MRHSKTTTPSLFDDGCQIWEPHFQALSRPAGGNHSYQSLRCERSQNGGQREMHHGAFFVFDRNCTQSGIYTAETEVEEGNTVKRGIKESAK